MAGISPIDRTAAAHPDFAFYAAANPGHVRAVAAVPCTISAEHGFGTWQSPRIQVSPGRASALTLILAKTDPQRRP